MGARMLRESGLALLPGLAVIMTVSMLPGCGSNTPTPVASPTPTPPPPVTQSIVASGGGSLPLLVLAPTPFTTGAAGTLDVTVDWTFATNNVDIYLARGGCSFDQFVTNQCNVV